MGNKNRTTGRKFERKIVDLYAKVFGLTAFNNSNHAEYQVSTSSFGSRSEDAMKNDIFFHPERIPKELKFLSKLKTQCKKTVSKGKNTTSIDVSPLDEVVLSNDEERRVLFTEVRKKKGKASREMLHGVYVTVEQDFFIELLDSYIKNKKENERDNDK